MSSAEDRAFVEKIRTIGFVGTKLRGDRSTFQRDFERKTDSELDTYEGLVKEGVQPDGTYTDSLDRAKELSDSYGFAYRGDNWSGELEKHGIVESTPFTEGEMSEIRASTPR